MSLGATLDQALSAVFPGWAAKRMAARARLKIFQRAIESTAINRLSGRTKYDRAGPKERTKRDLETSRSQARDLFRHNPYARGVINSIVANLIGCGIRPQARVYLPKKLTPDERFNDLAEVEWNRWADGCDVTGKENFYTQQQMLEREKFVAGEALVVLSTPSDKRKIPLATEIVPSERLALRDDVRKDGSKCIQGVEYNAEGQILGYWIYPNHPGDGIYRADQPKLVPADRVVHYFEALEPGQVRGLTRFMTVAGAFEGFMQWLDWLLTKERISSAFALAIIQNAAGISSPLLTGDTSDLTDEDGNEIDYLEGGIVAHLKPGEDIKGVASGVQPGAVDLLCQVFLRVIARGLDVSYELVSRDLSNVTYLSARQGENQDRRHWEPQQEAQNRCVNKRMWREFISAASASGVLPIRGDAERYYAVEFIRPGWDWIDPQKDITADVMAIQAGILSPLEAIVKRGGDPYKVLQDIATFKAWAREFGLELTIFSPAKKPGDVIPIGEGDGEDKDAEGGKESAAKGA